MLKNLSPLLTPSLLFGLSKMGHGDWLAIVDANFPAHRVSEQAGAALIEMPGLSSTQVLEAILNVFPVDVFEKPSSLTMQVVGHESAVPVPVSEFGHLLTHQGEHPPQSLERFAFYDLARSSMLIVQTGDLRKYANILLRKGVISVD
jgi:L-fucose mutarotase